ncbi:alpha-amylase family glycosyl hydrolase [Spirochaeta africana]|uniref:1,4-alpha-glucan branching enzyme n=1 Tax=Spirochaeta africana (strain ATCC 700263 / DSM 8902 / Z-7692) TaxID=889378 RepID=H9ULJ5_SPIAZ|nr:alpha-amylase family glycosyl hydrolase [Spirochaeta africana]AFG38388.1 1,4-alpha-glucan branching enzyme [Spirochaeta africana DSM 8902]
MKKILLIILAAALLAACDVTGSSSDDTDNGNGSSPTNGGDTSAPPPERDYEVRNREAAEDYNLTEVFAGDYVMPGPTDLGNGKFLFVLPDTVWNQVWLAGDMTGWADSPIEMAFDEVQGYWWVVAEAEVGDEYRFILNDPTWDADDQWISDPYGRAFRNDGSNTILIDTDYNWTTSNYSRPAREDLIIYEMHMDDFTREDSAYDSINGIIMRAKEKIPYLVELGINAVEIMPVQHWPGGWYSWGYNNSGYFAIESSLGSEEHLAYTEFKEFVDALHAEGIAVILDVVYNHTSNDDNWLWTMDSDTYFAGSTPWGNRLDFTQDATRKFFLDNMKFLLDEFRIDGFRFDATDYIDLNNGLLPLIQQLVDNGYDDVYYIFEQFQGSNDNKIGAFNDTNGRTIISSWGANFKIPAWSALDNQRAGNLPVWPDTLGAPTFFNNDRGWVSRPTDVVNFVSSHDEGTLRSQHTNTHLDFRFNRNQVALGHTHMFTSMGIPMMWMGDEIQRIHYGNMTPQNGFPYDNIDINANTVEWDDLYNNAADTDDSLRMLEYFKGLIALRSGNANLRRSSNPGDEFGWAYGPWDGPTNQVIAYWYDNGDDPALLIALNYGSGSHTIDVTGLPRNGEWTGIADSTELNINLADGIGTSLDVFDDSASLTLSAHQALIFRYE